MLNLSFNQSLQYSMKRIFTIALIMLLVQGTTVNAQQNEVNYDKEKIGPYTLEDPLRFVNGKKVKNMKDWELRRQEILDIFQREMYGQMPPKSDVYTEKLEEGKTLAGFATRRQIRMWFKADKTGPYIDWLVVTPNFVKGPAPTIMLLNYQGNHTVMTDPEIFISERWKKENDALGEEGKRICEESRGKFAGQNTRTLFPVGMVIARGYALVTACYGDISPDPDDADEQARLAYTQVFDLWGPRDDSRDDNTTALGAWGWALMRGMDMIEKDDLLDEKRVLLTGSSRLGKAALIAGAFDERFPVVVPNQTGGGGAPLAKRNFGENAFTMNRMFTHWYCKAYRKYAKNEQAMPFDQHLLLSCVAPRALMIQGFDEAWFDTEGEFLALKAASPVWEKFGKKGLPKVNWPDDYDTSAIGQYLAYVRRTEEHGISACDWTWMMDFADGVWGKQGCKDSQGH